MLKSNYQIIEASASRGKLSGPMMLFPSEIKRLRDDGFFVTSKGAPLDSNVRYKCTVAWDNPKGRKAAEMLAIAIKILKRRLPSDLQ